MAGAEPNVLRLGLAEPYVRLATRLNGPERTAENRELQLHTTESRRAPYANLTLDMLNSDPMLFIRGDEAEEAWRIIDPVMNAWTAGGVPMQGYRPARHYQAGRPDLNGGRIRAWGSNGLTLHDADGSK